jgi:hypothetical protein
MPKFKVRDGFVVKTVTRVDLGNDKFENQENTTYAGQIVELTTEQASDHAHKLEPAPAGKGSVDKDAETYLGGLTLPASAPAGLSTEHVALIQAVASATAQAVAAALAGGTAVAAPAAPAA